jgi:cytochrome c-type biogenesis protein CcmE
MNKLSIIGLLVMAVALAVIFSMVGDFSQDTTFKTAMVKPSKSFQIIGTLDTIKGMEYNPIKDPNYFSFYVKDKEGTIQKVVFRGSKPMDFERSESVTLTGNMTNEHFECKKILTKCPSKYQNDKEFLASENPNI